MRHSGVRVCNTPPSAMNARVVPLAASKKFSAKMNLQQSISYELCQPAIILGQVLGLLSWNFSCCHPNKCGKQHRRQILCIAYITMIKTVIMCTTAVRVYSNLKRNFVNSTQTYVYFASILIPATYIVLMTLVCILKAKDFLEMMKRLTNAEKMAGKIMRKQSLFLQMEIILQFFLGSAMLAVLLVRYIADNSSGVIHTLCYIVYLGLMTAHEVFLTVFFVITANLCAECVSSVNFRLKELVTGQTFALNRHVDNFQRYYEQLYQLADSIQDTFSLLITAQLGRQSFTVCLQLYFVLHSQARFDMVTLARVLVIVINAYRIFAITGAADNITIQFKIGARILSNVYVRSEEPAEGLQKLTILSHKLGFNAVEISAAGNLFKINKGTFVSIVSTIVTYVIILLQFNAPSTKDVPGHNTTTTNSTN